MTGCGIEKVYVGPSTLVSCIQGRRDNCYTVGEPSLELYVILVLSILRAVLTKPIFGCDIVWFLNSVLRFLPFLLSQYCGFVHPQCNAHTVSFRSMTRLFKRFTSDFGCKDCHHYIKYT